MKKDCLLINESGELKDSNRFSSAESRSLRYHTILGRRGSMGFQQINGNTLFFRLKSSRWAQSYTRSLLSKFWEARRFMTNLGMIPILSKPNNLVLNSSASWISTGNPSFYSARAILIVSAIREVLDPRKNTDQPLVGDTVDLAIPSWTNTIGAWTWRGLHRCGFQSVFMRLLLRSHYRDSDTALDGLRPS